MVLRPRPALWVATALALSITACLASASPQRLATSTPVAVVLHLESSSGRAHPVPDAVARGVEAVLAQRSLVPSVIEPAAAFATTRSTPQRLDLVRESSDAPWIMLLEARARFFSQLSGRYRWEVELRVSLVERAQPDRVHTSELSVPAFLLHEHETEPEALSFVRRQLEDDLASLVDRVFARDR